MPPFSARLLSCLALLILFSLLAGGFYAQAVTRPNALGFVASTLGLVAGPLIGALARGFQSCCLRVSLRLLAGCGPLFILGLAAQWTRLGPRWRLVAWVIAWLAWFGGGFLSLLHAWS